MTGRAPGDWEPRADGDTTLRSTFSTSNAARSELPRKAGDDPVLRAVCDYLSAAAHQETLDGLLPKRDRYAGQSEAQSAADEQVSAARNRLALALAGGDPGAADAVLGQLVDALGIGHGTGLQEVDEVVGAGFWGRLRGRRR